MVLSEKSPLFQSSHIITKSVIFLVVWRRKSWEWYLSFHFSAVLLWVGQGQLPALPKLPRTCLPTPYFPSPALLTLRPKHPLPSCLCCGIDLLSIILISFLTSVDFLNKDSTVILVKIQGDYVIIGLKTI